jgi:NitT/TauT family transport system permease protein
VPVWTIRLAILVAFICLWQLLSGSVIDPFWFSQPSAIWTYSYDWVVRGDFFHHVWITLQETFIGFAIGAFAALITGVLLARSRRLADILDPFLVALNAIPRVALAPLFVVWFGIGLLSKLVLVITLVFFIVFYNTFQGIRSVDRIYVDVARVMGAKEGQVFRGIVLPAATPYIVLGMKLSIPFALIGAVIGEFVASSAGLGWKIKVETATYNTTGTLAGIIVLMLVAMVLNAGLEAITRRALYWQPEQETRSQAGGF